ncbi:MAG: hypothetical protein Kow0042_26890 [Calditrichia bacterium]
MRFLRLLLIVIVLLEVSGLCFASTVGIATGNRTVDGRPLLFKNRDRTDAFPADVQYYQGSSALGEYSYVYHKNLSQSHTCVRMGINTAGFGIGNSDSENLSGTGAGMSNSQLLAEALRTCATIQDFRDLLDATNGSRDVHAHVAVIDAGGNGSLFEIDGWSYVELPVVDSVAVMANTAKYHPSAGPPAAGSTSPYREARAVELFNLAPAQGLDYRYFVQEIIKDFCLNQIYENMMPIGQYRTNPVLSRYKTVAGAVIRGCKPGDDPLVESVMWLTLGEPSMSLALPFFPNVDEVFDFIRYIAPDQGMPGAGDRIRQLVYDYSGGRYADQYADTYALVDIRSFTFPLQDSLFDNYEQQLIRWRNWGATQAADSMKFWTYDIHAFALTEYQNIYNLLTGLDSDETISPRNSFRLQENFPNPFNSDTEIEYYLPRSTPVRHQVFDLNGREIWHRQFALQNAGWHRIHLQFWRGYSGGVYFFRMRAGGHHKTIKMIYLP